MRREIRSLATLAGCRPHDVARLLGVSSLTLRGWMGKDSGTASARSLLSMATYLLLAPRARPDVEAWFAQNLREFRSKPPPKWYPKARKAPKPLPASVLPTIAN